MDNETSRKESIHNVGLELIKALPGQRVNDRSLRNLFGEKASLFLAGYIKDIFSWSGVTTQEAKAALSGVDGKHLEEVNRAIQIIEEEEQEKNLQEKE
jgi:hypothetical protein